MAEEVGPKDVWLLADISLLDWLLKEELPDEELPVEELLGAELTVDVDSPPVKDV